MTAYWIAFGAHGPRAGTPPGEGRKIFLGTAIGVVASLVLFATIRAGAKPSPKTLTKEYEEATNEYLKVGSSRDYQRKKLTCWIAGPKVGAHYRYLVRGLHWTWTGAKQASQERVDAFRRKHYTLFAFVRVRY